MVSREKKYVTVIMSTYNGHSYIKEQLDSLLSQKSVLINLFVRDDGSSDDTVHIIENYKNKFNALKLVKGKNLGPTSSFHKAAEDAKDCFFTEYYAFCDQDDIWLDNKLDIAISHIDASDNNRPSLYFSNLMMMTDDGQMLGMLLEDDLVSHTREKALAAIYTYGCTCVFNRKALEKFTCLSIDKKYIFHDNWMFAVCAFLGTVYYDKASYINYRQTGHNVSGNKRTGWRIWEQRLVKLFSLKTDQRIYESIAKELLNNFGDCLSDEDKRFLEVVSEYRKNIKYKLELLNSERIRTCSRSKNFCIKGRILLNCL